MDIDQHYVLPFSTLQIYAAWVSSETVIAPATRMEINPIVGGHYRLFIQTPDYNAKAEGIFLEINSGSHLKYTWEWNGDGKVTEITVDFSPVDDGSRIRIKHIGFDNIESMQMHSAGWNSYIDGLKSLLTIRNGEKNGK